MKKIKVKRIKEKKIIWNRTKHYIILWIITCCLIVSFNLHPNNKLTSSNNNEMIYVFHDYERNSYILNNSFHGSAEDLEYLFNDSTPKTIKWEDNNIGTVSLENLEINDTYDNQISIENIMNELWIDNTYIITDESKENTLTIDLSNNSKENNNLYQTTQDWQTLTITKSKKIISLKNNWNFKNDNINKDWIIVKDFEKISESWILPSLISRNHLKNPDVYASYEDEYNYTNLDENSKNDTTILEEKTSWWINTLPDYADCTTPRWYKISHWESVLAYKQIDNIPNICNIEKRICWNWKLSWTYSQQWCSINNNQTNTNQNTSQDTSKTTDSYKNNQNSYIHNSDPTIKLNTRQNKDWSVSVYKAETEWSFIFDKPSNTSTEFHHWNDNIKTYGSVQQTKEKHANCITPWWEEVLHGQLVQAFKHANWFYDIPCETQIRLCSMWKLDGSYSQESCKLWESSFYNRFNWGTNKDKYYENKIKKIKQKIQDEEKYYNEIRWLSEEEALDKIFYRLDE